MKSLAVNLGDFTKIKTGKLDANASSEDGEYPFFTCAQQPLRISSYSYDCECVLIAGNGDLNVKYYEGKFDAYQRTYIVEVLPEKQDKLHLRYAYHFLETYLDTLREQSIGGIIKYIKMGNLTDAQIPLPPLDEQKRIAAILDAADALRAKRRQSIAQLDALIQSTFLDLFGDPVTNPMGWEVKPLEELCSFLSGYAWKSSAFNSDQKGNPVIRIQNVGTQSTDFVFTTENPIDRFWIKRGDLLLSLSGSFRLAAWNGPPALLNQRIVKLTPQKSLSVSYFQAALSRQLGAIESMGRHALVNNVALSDLKQVRLILPPLPLQQKFAAIVESIERQKTTQRAHLAELDALFAAIQHRAFRGEL
jgi:type I restriction enzyme S subunit